MYKRNFLRIVEDLEYVNMLFTEATKLMSLLIKNEHLKQRTQNILLTFWSNVQSEDAKK